MTEQRDIKITVPVLARVEGEGALELAITSGRIEHLKLRIYEPPRLFEKFMEGHGHQDVLDMVARICGICPVAYQMSAVQGMEQLFGVEISPWVRDMRHIMYFGEWLQSHSLHIHLLAAPDFFGYNSALEMAKEYPDEVRRGLNLQTLGNHLIALFGARSVHPVGLCVGGFFKAPEPAAVEVLCLRLEQALPEAEALVHWCASLAFPEDDQPFTSVALRHPDEYAMYDGRFVSSDGLDIGVEEYEQHFTEFQVPQSTAFHSHYKEKPYLVGPLARLNLNMGQLPKPVLENMQRAGVSFPSQNMFHSIVARAVELHFAVYEALRLLKDYKPDTPRLEFEPRAGTAYGASEAPRGVLWHGYDIDAAGKITKAKIVPPTSQNQGRIEEDLGLSLQNCGLDQPDDVLRLRAEQVIRNYDPCISCATHFLKLDVKRS
jgi:coenzyme F420-reducing hydrogenase alpha subunit